MEHSRPTDVTSPKAQDSQAREERPDPGRRRHGHKAILVCLNTVVGVVCLEAGLRLWELKVLGDRSEPTGRVDCRGLEGPTAPCPPGSDAKGFRNDAVPTHADIVALGDSQTWGVNVSRHEAWPQQLATLSGLSVYNMSRGGFGAAHYAVLLKDALALSPQVLIIGLYLGNDIYDTYRLVYTTGMLPDLRSPDASTDLTTDAVALRATAEWNAEKTYHSRWFPILFRKPGLWLRGHSAIGRRLDSTLRRWGQPTDAWHEIGAEWAHENPEAGTIFDDGRVRTILTPAYRGEGLDLSEPRIAAGLRLTASLIPRLVEEAAAQDARSLILVIPTKEAVFSNAINSEGVVVSQSLARLVANERTCRREILERCKDPGIACVDLLSEFQQALARGLQIYPTSTDSHPNESGYALIAHVALRRLRDLGWLRLPAKSGAGSVPLSEASSPRAHASAPVSRSQPNAGGPS
jgi:lysophospholipase L1-like esterase